MMAETVGHKPCERLPLDLSLVVDALDREESFAKAVRNHDVVLELLGQALAALNASGLDFA